MLLARHNATGYIHSNQSRDTTQTPARLKIDD
jgi:hypothetical protein